MATQQAKVQNQFQNKSYDKSIFSLSIIQQLGQIGTESDLSKLRKASKDYNKELTPTYLDVANKEIYIRFRRSHERWKFINSFTTFVNTFDTMEDGVFKMTLNNENWNPETAYAFRKLSTNIIWTPEYKLYGAGLEFSTLVAQICPHISTLELHFVLNRRNDKITDTQLKYFIGQFTSLKNFVVHRVKFVARRLEELKVLLNALRRTVIITMYTNENQLVVYDKFRKMQINWIFQFKFNRGTRFGKHNSGNLKTLKRLLEQMKNTNNIKFNIKFCIGNLEGLKSTASDLPTLISLANQEQIQQLKLTFEDDNFSGGEEASNYLNGLRSFITELKFVTLFHGQTFRNLLCREESWPKLVSLTHRVETLRVRRGQGGGPFRGNSYAHPLEILKVCPKLQRLDLDVNQDLSIFHDTQKSDRAAIKEYFGGLQELQEFTLRSPGKISRGNELGSYLKAVLPHNARIRMV